MPAARRPWPEVVDEGVAPGTPARDSVGGAENKVVLDSATVEQLAALPDVTMALKRW